MRAAWLVIAATLLAVEARAGDCSPRSGLSPCIDADNLWPHPGGGPFFAVGAASTTPARQISFGLVLSWLAKPVGVTVASADPEGSTVFAVDKLLDATMLFAYGVHDRLELSIAVPAAVYQGGAGLSGVVASAEPPASSGLRDLRFGLAAAMLARGRGDASRGPALTGRLDFGVPVATRGALAGASSATLAPSVVFDYKTRRVTLAVEAFARLRREAKLANAVWGSQVGGAVGGAVDVLWDRWLTVGAEAFVLPVLARQEPSPREPDAGAPPLAPAEWIASLSTARLFCGDLVLSVGGGGSIPLGAPAALTSPRYRVNFGLRYAPAGHDGRRHPLRCQATQERTTVDERP